MSEKMRNGFAFGEVVDNKDKDKLCRVKVKVVLYDDVIISDWIGTTSDYSGNFFLPEIGDQVIVGFAGNGWDEAFVVGVLWNETRKPPATGENADGDRNKNGKNEMKYIKSRSGHMIIFDETKGKEKFQIIASGGKTRVEFTAKDKKLAVKTDMDMAVNSKKKIGLKGESITIKTKKEFSVKGGEVGIESKNKTNMSFSKDTLIKGQGVALN